MGEKNPAHSRLFPVSRRPPIHVKPLRIAAAGEVLSKVDKDTGGFGVNLGNTAADLISPVDLDLCRHGVPPMSNKVE